MHSSRGWTQTPAPGDHGLLPLAMSYYPQLGLPRFQVMKCILRALSAPCSLLLGLGHTHPPHCPHFLSSHFSFLGLGSGTLPQIPSCSPFYLPFTLSGNFHPFFTQEIVYYPLERASLMFEISNLIYVTCNRKTNVYLFFQIGYLVTLSF